MMYAKAPIFHPCGRQPDDYKPMPGIGQGVEELRIFDDTGAYRIIYYARLADAVYVLHAFQKKAKPPRSAMSTWLPNVIAT